MGFFYSLLAAATFGLTPFFSIPLMRSGLSPQSVLFYRFLTATVIMALILLPRRRLLPPCRSDIAKLAGVSLMYMLAALTFFWSFAYLPSGVAATIHFLYPVMVMLFMVVFFGESFSPSTALGVLLALGGVFLLGNASPDSKGITDTGLLLALLSALCNALYITGIFAARLRCKDGLIITFWLLLFSTLTSLGNALVTDNLQWLESRWQVEQICLQALVTAVISNLALVLAVQRIGSTLASVLGATEPLTAVLVGILVFEEATTQTVWCGVALVCLSVAVVMLGPQWLRRSPAPDGGTQS